MKPRTPKAKVYVYRMLNVGLWVVAVFSAFLGIACFTNQLLILSGTSVVALATAFASSQSKFAKEVDIIVQFCRKEKCSYEEYPTTPQAQDALREREELSLELTSLAVAVIDAQEKVYRCWCEKDDLGERAAIVQEQNAKSALRKIWDIHKHTKTLPFKNPAERIEWKDSQDFLDSVTLGIIVTKEEQERSPSYA